MRGCILPVFSLMALDLAGIGRAVAGLFLEKVESGTILIWLAVIYGL